MWKSADAVKEDEVVAEAVEEYVERAVEMLM